MTQLRILLPVLLGAGAAAGNYVYMSRHAADTQLVALRVEVKPGTPLKPEHFVSVGVRGGDALFAGTFRWNPKNLGALEGMTLRRPVKAGELLLRADVEHASHQIAPPPEGYRTLTLPARLPALAVRPHAGENVVLVFKQTSSASSAPVGPFRFLGWVAAPPAGGRDPDAVQVAVAVAPNDSREADLRRVAESGSFDRLVAVEVVKLPPGK